LFDIGGRIRELRLEYGISAKEIAISLSVTPSFISSIEKGNTKCSIENLELICNVIGIALAEFFSVGTPALEPDLKRLLDTAKTLTTDQRQALQLFLDRMKN